VAARSAAPAAHDFTTVASLGAAQAAAGPGRFRAGVATGAPGLLRAFRVVAVRAVRDWADPSGTLRLDIASLPSSPRVRLVARSRSASPPGRALDK